MATSSCASTTESIKPSRDSSAALSTLHARQAQQAARLEELEARISLLESEARKLRGGQESPARSEDTIRIGAAREHAAAATPRSDAYVDESSKDESDVTKRTHLRLYGRAGVNKNADLPVVPVVSETLSVAPLPTQRAAEQINAASSARETTTTNDAGVTQYLAGLRFLRERRFDDAVAAFDEFISEQPGQAMVPNALYWRGEARYAKRDYAQARGEFEAVLARYPHSEKAADSLLKLALCFRQLGSEDQARGAFRRLRAEYPNSQAATIAAREGAT